jgi:hypothetical protein
MSWGSAGNAVGGAFKAGLKREEQTGQMRNANDPTGQGYGNGRAPAPAAPAATPAPAPLQDSPQPAAAPVVAAAGAQPMSPMMSLLHAIWGGRY